MKRAKTSTMSALAVLMLASLVISYGCGDGNGTTCATGQQLCGGECVNTQNDARHCGGCFNACSSGQQCQNGTCTSECVPTSETCNGLDDDCDGATDENLTRDCSNPCGTGTETCNDGSWGNCNAPTATTEVCDGEDNDCDGAIDEDVKSQFYLDHDSDLYGDPNNMQEACEAPTGYVADNTDCDDNNADVSPGDTESCDTTYDDDCDGAINEDCTCTAGTTQQCGEGGDTGDCEWGTQTCQTGGTWGPCEGGVRPRAETCNGTDENCDGEIDNGMAEDAYEDNDSCAQARPLERADEGTGAHSLSSATLYSTDGSDDTDWYTIEAVEATHLECVLHPLDDQCYFYLDISLTPAPGSDHNNWSFCVHIGTCGSWDNTFCTDSSNWDAGAYTMVLYWSGSCGLDDGWTFYVEVDGSTGEENCQPYTLRYEFDFEGGIGDEYCI